MMMHVMMDVKYGKLPQLFQTMPRVQAIVEAAGWQLRDALYFLNGPINSAVHIWELRDMNHYHEGVMKLSQHPEFEELSGLLSQIFERETISFADHAPYSPKFQAPAA